MITIKKLLKRKTLLVEKRFQLEFIFTVVIIFLIAIVISLLNFTSFLSNILPQAAIISTKTRIILFLISTLIILSVAVIVTLVYSNKIIGPIPRLEKEIKEMTQTNKYHCIKVREKDRLKHFIDSINILIKKLQEESKN